jgi:predicted thioredoxin/glutaredoxin
MKTVTLGVTKTCPHCQVLTKYFEEHGVPCKVKFIEEDPEFSQKHDLTRSPNVLVNDEVVYRGMPTPEELERIRQMCELPAEARLARTRSSGAAGT